MKKLTLLLLIFPFFTHAQEKGIQFQHGTSWADIQAKAKAENKFIFMDCFTTWCGPCRYMSTTIFPMDNVGAFMNDHFINVKVQLDTTDEDNDAVKSWYQDGHNIAAQYKVRAYPTYLFFDPNGNLVHRAVGSSTADEFLAKAGNAINPETQYYTLLNKYNNGEKDSGFLRKMALAARDAYDMENGGRIASEYLNTQTDLYTKTNLEFIQYFTQSSKDKGFNILLKDPAKADAILGDGVAENIVHEIIMQEEILAKFPKAKDQKPDWTTISASITKKYPAQAPEALSKGKVVWYQHIQDWNNYQTAIVAYMNKYGSKTSPYQLNSYAWTVFQNCNDMACVAKALEWSKRSLKENNEPAFIDTYANLLYKLGKKDEAIIWEQKAFDLAPESDRKDIQETLDKMKAGEKTWN